MSASLVRATVRAVSKRKLQPTRAALTLTPSAVNKIKQLLKDKPEHVGVKVGVRTRGCNGLSYTLEYTKTKGDSDEEVIQDGVRVFIEKKAQLTLLGTEMDYVEDKLSSSRKARGSLVAHCRNRVTHMLENKVIHLENEASVLDSRRNDICILYRGQKVRSHHSLWII
uniref:Iron-sulfur cluster assembly 1 homolog, mitochondrial n=1 Tax=Macaca mulatta TaxID=9544 RepID=F7FEI1_MACMU